jgi:hypothetical protein
MAYICRIGAVISKAGNRNAIAEIAAESPNNR